MINFVLCMFYHKEIVLKERVDFPVSPWSGSRSEGELSEPGQLWDRVLTSPDSCTRGPSTVPLLPPVSAPLWKASFGLLASSPQQDT